MPMVTYGFSQEVNDLKKKKHNDHCEHTEETQTHVHEFLGSTKLEEENGETHNHRFAGVTSEAIPVPGGHVHALLTNTDFFDHHHEIGDTTDLQVVVDSNSGKHVHFVCGTTTFDDGHAHEYQFATLIDSPLV